MTSKLAAAKVGALHYLRVSTKDQEKNLSIQTQRTTCRDYCERIELKVLAEFHEAASAKTAEHRPQFQSMLEYCQRAQLAHYQKVLTASL